MALFAQTQVLIFVECTTASATCQHHMQVFAVALGIPWNSSNYTSGSSGPGSYVSGSSIRSASTSLDGVVAAWSASVDAASLLPGTCCICPESSWIPCEILRHFETLQIMIRFLISWSGRSGRTFEMPQLQWGTYYSICVDTVAWWSLFVPTLCTRNHWPLRFVVIHSQGWICWCTWSWSSG